MILGVVIAVLFLMSINFTQAQGNSKKVELPPESEDTWAVRIPTLDSGNMFYGIGEEDGDDGYYEDNDPNIVVSVKKNSPGT